MIEIVDAEPLDGFWLRLKLSTGDVIERDVSDLLLGGPVFEDVRLSREVFEAVFVDGGTVAWPGRADIAPETLIWDGPEPANTTRRPRPRLRLRAVGGAAD